MSVSVHPGDGKPNAVAIHPACGVVELRPRISYAAFAATSDQENP